MLYDKKIKYLDYYENGERLRGGGFVKLEARDRIFRMDMSVSGLYPTDAFEREVILCGHNQEKAVGKIKIVSGKGTFQYLCRDIRNMGKDGISYEELRGIRIPLGGDREIRCSWQESKAAEEAKAVRGEKDVCRDEAVAGKGNAAGRKGIGKIKTGGEINGAGEMEAGSGISGAGETEAAGEMNDGGEAKAGAGIYDTRETKVDRERSAGEEAKDREANAGNRLNAADKKKSGSEGSTSGGMNASEKSSIAVRKQSLGSFDQLTAAERAGESGSQDRGNRNSNEKKRDSGGKPVRLLEDKWQQLYAIYPHIHPFEDSREYLSISPADFVLFPAESYRMVNNSFLLHGYYNYRHLILAKIEKKGEVFYYIGVPGNFYEKEKQVAIMFGFESFECAEEPAQAGDFGYYMMRTEL